MAAKLDQTAESICGPKWAIARDLSIYEGGSATTTKGSKVSADRGPPMASFMFSYDTSANTLGI
jgi:ATP citrate (pro-S)-lyase